MPKLILCSYFSQQDKRTGKLSLSTDSACKFLAYVCDRSADAIAIVPMRSQRADRFSFKREIELTKPLSLSNRDRRFQTLELAEVIPSDATHVVTTHETLAHTLRCLRPELKIAMECGFDPLVAWPETAELMKLSWRAADLVYCASEPLRALVAPFVKATALWRFAYADRIAMPIVDHRLDRDVDALFNSRCSATGYSNHELFVSATEGLSRIITDPTRYLSDAEPMSQGDYEIALRRCRCVVGLMRSGHTGFSFIEAIAAGCCPVALRTPAYEALLTPGWPYLCEEAMLRQMLERALRLGWAGVSSQLVRHVQLEVAGCSYSATLEKVKQWVS